MAQRRVRTRGSADAAWEFVLAHLHLEPEQRRIVQKYASGLLRLAHSLGLLRTGDWTRY